jgi:hypothetical protein
VCFGGHQAAGFPGSFLAMRRFGAAARAAAGLRRACCLLVEQERDGWMDGGET